MVNIEFELKVGKKYYITKHTWSDDVCKAKLIALGKNFAIMKRYFFVFLIEFNQILAPVEVSDNDKR